MDYLDFKFHYKGKKSIWRFKHENIDGKLNNVTYWSGYVEFNEKRIYFQNCCLWYIIIVITDVLEEKEAFIKLSLQCKTKKIYQFLP